MASNESTSAKEERSAAITLANFLESRGADSRHYVSDLLATSSRIQASKVLLTPEIDLHCETCKGERRYQCREGSFFISTGRNLKLVKYVCENCGKAEKKGSLTQVGCKNSVKSLRSARRFRPD